jgi:MATE family multidrug resistance protein
MRKGWRCSAADIRAVKARETDARDALSHRRVLTLALPIILSNVSTPLIGVVDTAVVGRLSDPAYIGAAAIGGLIFTFVFWGFGFLRMGTTGLTAQASGAHDIPEVVAALGRALLVALIAGVVLIALQWPIRETASTVLHASARVDGLARGYYDIRIWAAPATLANYALLGWFIGLGRTDIGLLLQLILNLVNMALDVLFVLGWGWDVRGVALGTLLAEYFAASAGIFLAMRHVRSLHGHWSMQAILASAQLRRTLLVNRDIMIRSLALIVAFLWFASQGARQGDVILAGNSILLQFISVAAFFLDGVAFATEALVGEAFGLGRRLRLTLAIKMTTAWAAVMAMVLSAALLLLGPWLIDGLTVDSSVRAAARAYLPWAAGAPLLSVWAYQLDGIFIGATKTAEMRNAGVVSLAIFLAAWWLLSPWGNHGLWGAFYVLNIARAVTLSRFLPRLVRAVPAIG